MTDTTKEHIIYGETTINTNELLRHARIREGRKNALKWSVLAMQAKHMKGDVSFADVVALSRQPVKKGTKALGQPTNMHQVDIAWQVKDNPPDAPRCMRPDRGRKRLWPIKDLSTVNCEGCIFSTLQHQCSLGLKFGNQASRGQLLRDSALMRPGTPGSTASVVDRGDDLERSEMEQVMGSGPYQRKRLRGTKAM